MPAAIRARASWLRAYFDTSPTPSAGPTRCCTSGCGEHLAERAVRRIIVVRYVWCDLWHAEVGRLQESLSACRWWSSTSAAATSGLARIRTRIEALLEMLR